MALLIKRIKIIKNVKNKTEILTVILLVFSLSGCIQEKGNNFYSKSSNLGGGESSSGDGLLPPPSDEPEEGGDDDEQPEPTPPGEEDPISPRPPIEETPGSGGEENCPVKIDGDKVKKSEISLDDIDCDNNKVVVCHKASSNTRKYVLKYVDKKSLMAHLDHQDRRDFLIKCSKIQVINTVLNPSKLSKACNCD